MTKEEAIEKLEYAKTQCEWTFTPDFVIAFDTGIQAIKKLEEVENILKTARFNDEESVSRDIKETKWYTNTKFDIKDGDTYFAIDTDGSIDEIEYGDFPGLDVNGAYFGNVCKDIEYLERRLPEITLSNRLHNFAEVVNEGWKPDWRNRDELKYSVACNNIPKIWEIAQHRKTSFPNTVYFKTEELAQRAIDEIVIPWEKEFGEND